MGSAFRIVNIVAEAQDILMEFIDVLERCLHGNALTLSLEINHVMHGFLGLVHILHEAGNAVGLMEGKYFCLFPAPVLKNDRQIWVQISGLMKAAFHVVLLETGLVKNGVVRQEIDDGSRFPRLAHHREKPVFQRDDGISPLIFILINKTACFDLHSQSGGKRVDYG